MLSSSVRVRSYTSPVCSHRGSPGANRSCAAPSTTRSASSRNASRNVNAEGGVCADSGGPPSACCRPLGLLIFHEEASEGRDYQTLRDFYQHDPKPPGGPPRP